MRRVQDVAEPFDRHLDLLEIDNAKLQLPKDDEPFELPHWPDVLPAI